MLPGWGLKHGLALDALDWGIRTWYARRGLPREAMFHSFVRPRRFEKTGKHMSFISKYITFQVTFHGPSQKAIFAFLLLLLYCPPVVHHYSLPFCFKMHKGFGPRQRRDGDTHCSATQMWVCAKGGHKTCVGYLDGNGGGGLRIHWIPYVYGRLHKGIQPSTHGYTAVYSRLHGANCPGIPGVYSWNTSE